MNREDRWFWVLGDALELLQNAERLQRRFFFAQAAAQSPVPCWTPSVDLFEQDDELQLLVALPGVAAGQFEVLVDESAIVVRGRRPMPSALRRAAIHRLEIPYGRFERRIALPAGRFRLDQQIFKDGCLVLILRHH